MSSIQELLSASTNFYKLTSVSEIKYTTFSHPNSDDQALLNAELDLRKKLPKVLAAIYGKELWTFSIDENDPPLTDARFELKQSSVNSFSPSLIYRSSSGVSSSLMPVLVVTFLKSLKRLLVNNLSFRKEIIPFGNAGLLSDLSMLHIEPKLLEKGDIVCSITSTNHNLKLLQDLPGDLEAVNQSYALYLAPSGIRVYLSDNTINLSTTGKPSNHSFIVDSLSYLHNLQIDPNECTWIKVIPNLPHLNGMSSQVSNYLKPVTNSKYLSWPLELCVVQKAVSTSSTVETSITSDPLSLIDDFVKLKATSNAKTPSTAPTANNTPMTVESHNDHLLDHRFPQHDTQHPQTVTNSASPANNTDDVNINPINEGWSDLDEELFGEGAEVTDADFNFFNGENGSNDLGSVDPQNNGDIAMNDNNSGDNAADSAPLKLDLDDSQLDDLFDDENQADDNLASELELLTETKAEDDSNNFLDENVQGSGKPSDPYDIPVLQVTDSPLYTDPGAPLPVQSPRTTARKRSIFSPLNFNPIIRSNVDNKYSTGGKFFVPNVETPTSDSSIPMATLGDTVRHDEDSEDSDDDDESASDDYDEEDYAEDDDASDNVESDQDINMTLDDISQEKSPGSGSLEPEAKRFRADLEGNDLPLASTRSTMSPEATNGVPNPLPFLLRSIPVHSIPSYFYKENPSIPSSEVNEFLQEFLNQVIWDDTCHQDSQTTEDLNSHVNHENIVRAIAQVFPEVHKENLSEFTGIHSNETSDSPLSPSFKEPEYIHTPNVEHNHNSVENQISRTTQNFAFAIPQPKLRVKRLSQEISINSSALNFWNLMSFNSLNEPKHFRILLVTSKSSLEQSNFFLSTLVQTYEKSQLGSIERFSAPGITASDGLLPVDTDKLESSIMEAAEKIQEVLLKSQSNKELLLIIPKISSDLDETVNIIRTYQKFKKLVLSTSNGKQSPANILLKTIPMSYITNRGVLSVVSMNLLNRLSLSLYNSLGDPNSTFTSLSVPLPEKINFQLTKQHVASDILSQDSFIHLAYERSIDKEWLVTAWSDQYSTVREVKAWNCSPRVKNNLEIVMNNIWSNSLAIASKLPGKKYLVLVRSDGAIPDDELLQWKRLSSKSRELTLVVISVDQCPSLQLQLSDPGYPIKKIFNQDEVFGDTLIENRGDSVPTVGSSTGLTPSTSIFTPQPVNSPDLFSTSKSGGHDSPSDARLMGDDQGIIVDVNDLVHAVLIDGPNSLANSPIRLGVKTGYLIKPIPNSKNKLKAFELNLMSCPQTLGMEELMKTILIQFRNLATIAELWCVASPEDTLIPWHIQAVSKGILCLSHLCVDEGNTTAGATPTTSS